MRRFRSSGGIVIECGPGRDISVLRGGSGLRLTVADAHFIVTRLPEAMREALLEVPIDLRQSAGGDSG